MSTKIATSPTITTAPIQGSPAGLAAGVGDVAPSILSGITSALMATLNLLPADQRLQIALFLGTILEPSAVGVTDLFLKDAYNAILGSNTADFVQSDVSDSALEARLRARIRAQFGGM